jgi:hypothetical protein
MGYREMSIGNALLRVLLLVVLSVSNAVMPTPAAADCSFSSDGRIISITVQSCEVIDGGTNKDVLKYSGGLQKNKTIQRLYTGALVTADRGFEWVYPSLGINPCQKFPKSAQVTMMAYLTCCDSGPWGKCVFGGRWLGDVHCKPVNAWQ